MFETVVPEVSVKPSRRVFYETLPLSLFAHAGVILLAVVATSWTVVLPMHSPAQPIAFAVAEPPPPPPPPPPPRAVRQVKVHPMRTFQAFLAPSIVPDEIPLVTEEPVQMVEGVEGGVAEGGVPEGSDYGVSEGEIGGVPGGVVGGIVVEAKENRVQIERDKPLGMFPLSQVYPAYPEEARLKAIEDQLVVRYVIGKDGRVKEVVVISPPEHEIFVRGTVRALRSWRFRPMVKNGERIEVVHELTIFYKLNQNS